MNKLLAIIVAILLVSCVSSTGNQNQESVTVEVANFDWLLGQWERINGEDGKNTFEDWVKINEEEYQGFGYTMQGFDTISQESIKVLKVDGNWRLEVISPNENSAIVFALTSIEDDSFVCENPEHDFPTLIKYWKDKQNLKALVANDEMEISFEFVKVD